MNVVRSGTVLVVIAALGIVGAVIIKQHLRIRSLRENKRGLVAQYRELSATNTSLLSANTTQNDEIARLQEQPPEVLRLRSQLTQAQQQLAAAAAGNPTSQTENTNDLAGYVTKEQLKFVGFDTPENAFQSLNWAEANGDYTNWLASLAPADQEEELANPKSLEEFQHRSPSRITGTQVLAVKPIGNNRVELKVRVDTDNAVTILIFPMVAVGNEWKLGDDIDSYTRDWDSSGGTP
ncbi:MAG TPA: hypothetical protein VH597_13890 [Verrucomicrobiae bacterium]|nr:hypothetical protein [Verrucomicrobiae bacterium]